MREAAEFGFEKARGFAVGIVHPGFMYSEMTKGGVDKCWDQGGDSPCDAGRSSEAAGGVGRDVWDG